MLRTRGRRASVLLASFVVVLVGVFAPGSASAATEGPQWTVTAVSNPTNFAPGTGTIYTYTVIVTNTGSAASAGTVDVRDILPEGLTAAPEGASGHTQMGDKPLSCMGLVCTYSGEVVVDETLVINVPVTVDSAAPESVTNHVTVIGGGAPEAAVETPTAISSVPASFGIAPGSASVAMSSVQAGAHADVSTTLAFTTKGLIPNRSVSPGVA